MKINCPACKLTIEGDSPLALTVELAHHILSLPDDDKHKEQLSAVLEGIDREVTFAATTAHDDASTRKLFRDKAVNLNIRLETFYIYATAHLSFVAEACRDALLESGEDSRITDKKAAQELWSNLKESLQIAQRRYRHSR